MPAPIHSPRRPRGFSLIEVLVAVAILTAGVMTLVAAFPMMLEGGRQAELLTEAAALAQQKAEEIRRDDSADGRLVAAIRARTEPTDPITFPQDPRLAYAFTGQTVLFSDKGDSDPRAAPNVARVLIRYAPSYKPSQDVLYELRFN